MNTAAVAAALKNRNVLVTLLGFTAFTMVLHGAWLAAIFYAFSQGGAGETGLVSLGVLVPAAMLSPVVAVWFDRFEPRIALALGSGLQGLFLFATAASVWADVSKFAVYALLTGFSIAQMSSRPTVSSALPRIVRDPVELAAANSATGSVETIGLVLGPAAAGLLLLANSPAVPFAVCGAAMSAAALAALSVQSTAIDDSPGDGDETEGVWSQVVAGLSLLRTESAPRNLVIVLAAMRLIVGVLEIGVVVVAIERLGLAEASAGVLGMAIGLGAIVGSALTYLLIGRRRLSIPVAVGVATASLPVALIGATTNFWVILMVLGVAGLGRPIAEVAGKTLLQGLSSDDMLARVFGFLEGMSLLMVAIGGALFSGLVVLFDLETALLISALAPCAIVLVLFSQLRAIDATRPEVDPRLLTLVRSTPLFAPLAAFRVEQLALNMHRQYWPPRGPIFSKGDHGEVLYIVHQGWVHIGLETELGLRRGGFFGEIAVLRQQPRMASAWAGSEGAVTYRIHRDVFLDALATAPSSGRRADRIISDRLGGTSC